MKRVLGATIVLVLGAGALTGCGGSSSNNGASMSTYCGDIKSTASQLKGLGSTDALTSDKFSTFASAVHRLAGEAPSKIKPQWTLMDSKISYLQKALSDAGVSMDDISKLEKGQIPPGVDLAKLQALGQKMKTIATPQVDAAGKAIDKEVKADCHVDLQSTSK